jgi:hypothetical protein
MKSVRVCSNALPTFQAAGEEGKMEGLVVSMLRAGEIFLKPYFHAS